MGLHRNPYNGHPTGKRNHATNGSEQQMSEQPQEHAEGRAMSRRSFLTKGPLGIVAGITIGVVGGRLLGSMLGNRSAPPQFPEDSIFRPAKDQNQI